MDSSEYGIITDDEGTVIELERYARWQSILYLEWTFWLLGILAVIINGLMWLYFEPPNSVSMGTKMLSNIFLGLLLLPWLHFLSFHRDLLRQKIQLRMKKELTEGVCPVCGYDLRGQELIDAECLRCPECGSLWKVGKVQRVGRGKNAAEVFWFISGRLATVLVVGYFVLVSLRMVDLFLTVRSVIFVCGIVLTITLALKFWHWHYGRARVG